jgi:radical SAM superfamily enzyme YgiQ (UPF0313 family)
MKTNVLMVYPVVPPSFWSYNYLLPYTGRKSLLPPLGLLTVAAMLPERYLPRVIDMNVSELTAADVEWADLVFISAMAIQHASFDEVVRSCRRLGKTVVAGGPYAWSGHEVIEGVDHFVLNEAETTLRRFLRDYEQGTAARIYVDDERPDLATTPIPRFDLIDANAYLSMPLQYSRGCPFNCEFCDIIEMFGRTVRTKEPAQFTAEMSAILESGYYGDIFIVDDSFIAARKRVKETLRAIVGWQKEHGYPYPLYTEATIDLAHDEELLDLMVEAGFTMVFIGIESPDPAALELIDKKQNLKGDMVESVRKIQNKGIMVMGGFIVGFDTDTEDIFDAQFDFIQQAGIPVAMIGVLAAMPNTRLYRRLEREGRLIPEVRHCGDNVSAELNFVPRMPMERLKTGYRRMFERIYAPKNYYDRCLILLSAYPQTEPGPDLRLVPKNMPAGRRALLGVKGLLLFLRQVASRHGLDYLKFIYRATRLARQKKIAPTFRRRAILEATKGYHLFRTARRILATIDD